jgi:hypothetical protein
MKEQNSCYQAHSTRRRHSPFLVLQARDSDQHSQRGGDLLLSFWYRYIRRPNHPPDHL